MEAVFIVGCAFASSRKQSLPAYVALQQTLVGFSNFASGQI